jgi:Fe-S cluster assembly protein SufD
MTTLTPDMARRLAGPAWLTERRAAAAALAAEVGLPSPDEEVWRYSPIDRLDLGAWSVPEPHPEGAMVGPPGDLRRILDPLARRAATVVVRNGTLVMADVEPRWADAGLEVARVGTLADGESLLGAVAGDATDVFDHLNDAFAADPIVVRVPAGLVVTDPVLVVDWSDANGAMVASRLVVATGADAEVEVVEWQGGDDSVSGLYLPVTELAAGPASRLRYLGVQERSRFSWQIGAQYATADRDATVVLAHAALGGAYARTRAHCHLAGRGASAEMTAAYLGEGDQTLDFRTFQHHDAPDTSSDLLFAGAVADTSRSIYTGTIAIAPGGRGSNANQTNRNLKLSEGAWAESVPNLEIENNDVRCSHASTVGPVDADQLFYLASRGVPPAEAERLIVAGFFDEPVRRMPGADAATLVRRHFSTRLRQREAT